MDKLKIQYCSDLHLEFKENAAYIKKHPILPKSKILILAGDIIPFAIMNTIDWFFDALSLAYEQVYWIAGNHEYYGYDLKERKGKFSIPIRNNIHLVNNTVIKVENVKIVLTTLWSKISDQNSFQIQRGMNDFFQIRFGDQFLNANHYNTLFEENFSFIKKETENKKENEKLVIVTHHVPTFYNYPKRFKGSVLNEAFATELFDFISEQKINFWIYGHSHSNTPNFLIEQTTLVSNQLGYISHHEQDNYEQDKTISV